MRFYADLHIHSHFSRATSKNLDLEHLYLWAQLKGIHVVGTGDCVHPGWMKELEEKLEPAEEGFFKLKTKFAKPMDAQVPPACRADVRFALTVEISNIYKRLDKVRKVHNLIWFPSFEAAKNVQAKLGAIGNIKSDGRPILGLDSRDLLEIALEADKDNIFVPAHIWTPWFSALGSMGGFDRMEDCFADLTDHIFAVETGLSSDPLMNWRLKQLDPFILVSNSDAHSPPKLGREANIFDTEFSYRGILNALKDPKDKGLVGTLEFFPEEGKYHYDGHRVCQARLHPKETIAHKGLCPVCRKPVTVGVMARVEELADRPEGEKSPRWRPYTSLIPLPELIAEAKDVGPSSKQVQEIFMNMLAKLGSEFHILMDAPIDVIKKSTGEIVAEGISRMRQGKVKIAAGYDGEFGTINIFSDKERQRIDRQLALF
ncbi:MAG: endonuclease Q family protein [Candidatus Omnitrophota bacterium]|nr:endonuclease Q family protein [Candidatus Omnitrophota bacterium]